MLLKGWSDYLQHAVKERTDLERPNSRIRHWHCCRIYPATTQNQVQNNNTVVVQQKEVDRVG
jgi:proline racemase